MNEYILQNIAICKMIWIVGFAYLYALGGISGKWKRRYIGPTWMMMGVVVFTLWQAKVYGINTWSWWYLAYWPLLIGALHLGYGAEETKDKIKRRFLYGLALAFSAAPLAIINGAWILWSLHCGICVVFSVILGVFSPARNARNEEVLIGTSAVLLPLFVI